MREKVEQRIQHEIDRPLDPRQHFLVPGPVQDLVFVVMLTSEAGEVGERRYMNLKVDLG